MVRGRVFKSRSNSEENGSSYSVDTCKVHQIPQQNNLMLQVQPKHCETRWGDRREGGKRGTKAEGSERREVREIRREGERGGRGVK